jgi:hypothetical protein
MDDSDDRKDNPFTKILDKDIRDAFNKVAVDLDYTIPKQKIPEFKKCSHDGCSTMIPKQSRKYCTEHHKMSSTPYKLGTKHGLAIRVTEVGNEWTVAIYYKDKIFDIGKYNPQGKISGFTV